MNPKISVIMSAYNSEKYLAEAIKSILNQIFRDFEFIIINDKSTDNTLNIIKRYSKKDKRIKIINNPKNMGLTKSLNKGLRIAKGEYIARMDADDISLPERFQIQYDYLEKNRDIFLVGTGAIYIDSNSIRLKKFIPLKESKKIKKRLKKENALCHPTIMFRNEHNNFYREKFRYAQDYDFYLNLLTKDKNINNIEGLLMEYRIFDKDSISSKNTKSQLLLHLLAKRFLIERISHGNDSYKKINFKDKKQILNFLNFKKIDLDNLIIEKKIILLLKNNKYLVARDILSEYKSLPKYKDYLYNLFAKYPPIYKIYRLIRYGS